MTPRELEMLINHGEDEKTERKKVLKLDTKADKAEFVRDMLSLVNAHGDRAAHLLVGIDNQGQKHGIGGQVVDDAALQQLVNSLVDPPINFSYRPMTLESITVGVISISPSPERFHVVKKKYQENATVLLDEGETWIRNGSSKRRPTAWDYKLLKEEHAKSQSGQPDLKVVWANWQDEVAIAADWTDHRRKQVTLSQQWDRVIDPYPPGTAPVCFCIVNNGSTQAQDVTVHIDVPDGCLVPPKCYTTASLMIGRHVPTSLYQVDEHNQIQISPPNITHGLSWRSPYGWVVFPRPNESYNLRWTAHAANMRTPTKGVLHVNLLGREVPPTKTFPGDTSTDED